MISIFLLTFILIFISWCVIHRLMQVGKPGFKTWPLIGTTLDVSANYHQIHDWILRNFEAKNANTYSAPLLTHSYVFTVDPANVEHVLKTNFPNYPKGHTFHERFEPLLGNGIFNSDDEDWKIQRKTASFEFSSRNLRDFSFKLFKEYALILSEIITNAADLQMAVDMQDLLMRMTLEAICNLGFGVKLGILSTENEFATAFDKCNAIISYRFADPFWKVKRVLGIGEEGQLNKYLATVNDFTYNIIRQRRLQIQSDKNMKHDILSRFMMLGENTSDKNLRDIVLNFVIAGRDTTAGTLTYFIYMVASHPYCAKKIREELLNIHQSEPEDLLGSIRTFSQYVTYESLSKLPYLHASITETLRLYPAVPLNFKGILHGDILPDGTKVKAGDIISYPPYAMGRMKWLWGENASEFHPERWFTNGEWNFNVSPFKFTAFQAGPRICLGKDSAYLQMKITAAILCRFFDFELVPHQELHYRVMSTISLANGLKVIPRVYIHK